jgi:amino acid transporter
LIDGDDHKDTGPKDTRPEERAGKRAGQFHPDLIWRDEVAGHRPGDKVVRIARHRFFFEVKPGVLLPRPAATEPRNGTGRLLMRAKRLMIGDPISSDQESAERLSKFKALAVLSPDALSSVAYGTEAAMRILVLAGTAALGLTLPVSIAIALLLIIVATSYQQTIPAYPSGGGSYLVAHENLGAVPGLIAGASLIVGYVLTVAVSIAAGADALVSAFPELEPYSMQLMVGAVVLVTVANLRGVREAGSVFVFPTYAFVFAIFGLIAFGLLRMATGGIPYTPGPAGPRAGTEALSWFLVLSAFAKGCSAMTGTEAIANAVPAFQSPEPKNARATLGIMAGLLAAMFIGVSFLVTQIGLVPDPDEHQTVLSELTKAIVGENWYYYVVQFTTAAILTVAANTCFAGFPWLLNIMARDRYVPSWFGFRGDRLVFSTGMISLSVLSVVLLLAFQGSVDRLLPLYAIGVFTAFTLSQSGMVVHWLKGKEKSRRQKAIINGFGALATATVSIVIGITKFSEGAWIVIVIVPLLVGLLLMVNRHYRSVALQLQAKTVVSRRGTPPLVLVPVSSMSVVARQAACFAQDLSKRVVAVHVTTDMADAEKLKLEWQEQVPDVPLVIIESPYRLVVQPLLAYVDALQERHPGDGLVVMLPEFVPNHWWQNLLHNQTPLRIKASLLFRPGIVVASMPFQLAD